MDPILQVRLLSVEAQAYERSKHELELTLVAEKNTASTTDFTLNQLRESFKVI